VFLPRSEFIDALSYAGLLVVQALGIENVVLSKLYFLFGHAVKLSFVGLFVLYTDSDYILLDGLKLVVLHL
jgi:hypothetical protein